MEVKTIYKLYIHTHSVKYATATLEATHIQTHIHVIVEMENICGQTKDQILFLLINECFLIIKWNLTYKLTLICLYIIQVLLQNNKESLALE